jgi:hypothetical protein
MVHFSTGLKVEELKKQCKARKLKVGGNKAELVSRLQDSDNKCKGPVGPVAR